MKTFAVTGRFTDSFLALQYGTPNYTTLKIIFSVLEIIFSVLENKQTREERDGKEEFKNFLRWFEECKNDHISEKQILSNWTLFKMALTD